MKRARAYNFYIANREVNYNRWSKRQSLIVFLINYASIICDCSWIVTTRMTTSSDAPAKAATVAEPTATASTTSADPPKLSATRDSSWPAVLFYIHLNILGLYGIVILFTNTYLTTMIFTVLLTLMGIVGVTCGAHRLWAHQTYKANTFLRIVLMLCQTMAGQVCDSCIFIFIIASKRKLRGNAKNYLCLHIVFCELAGCHARNRRSNRYNLWIETIICHAFLELQPHAWLIKTQHRHDYIDHEISCTKFKFWPVISANKT